MAMLMVMNLFPISTLRITYYIEHAPLIVRCSEQPLQHEIPTFINLLKSDSGDVYFLRLQALQISATVFIN